MASMFAAPSEQPSLRITDVRISLLDEEKVKAFVTITLEDCFAIRGLKVIHGNNGLFVAMPSRRKPDGTFQDIAHPITRETREHVEEAVLTAYHAKRDSHDDEGEGGAGVFAKLKPRPPTLFGKARLKLGSEEEA